MAPPPCCVGGSCVGAWPCIVCPCGVAVDGSEEAQAFRGLIE